MNFPSFWWYITTIWIQLHSETDMAILYDRTTIYIVTLTGRMPEIKKQRKWKHSDIQHSCRPDLTCPVLRGCVFSFFCFLLLWFPSSA
jgi:hypothetical protein